MTVASAAFIEELDIYFNSPEENGVSAYFDFSLDDVTMLVADAPGGTGTGNGDGSASVVLDLTVEFQTHEGFGAATAWWLSQLVDHPLADEIYPIIFEDHYSGHSVFRGNASDLDDLMGSTEPLKASGLVVVLVTSTLAHWPKAAAILCTMHLVNTGPIR